MITPPTFFGYPGQVWQACYQTLSWFSAQLVNGTAPAQQQVSSTAVALQTLLNGIGNVTAWQTGAALNAEVQSLQTIKALPITLDPATLAYFNARSAAYAAAALGVAALPVSINVTNVTGALAAGQPAISDPKYLEWCMTFAGETPPATFTTASALPTFATAASTAWQTVASTVAAYQGNNLTSAYDAAVRIAQCSLVVSATLNSLTSGPFAASGLTALWSQCVSLPSILLDAASLYGSPNSLQNQQCGVIRYVLYTMAFALSQFLLTLRRPSLTQINQAGLRTGDTLMDVAARSLGNFEQWSNIATLNGLLPPYPGVSNASLVGQQVLLPGSTGAVVSGAAVPTYAANVLGTDYDFGPINGTQSAWTGDFALITGLLNFARALGRRLQTPLGSLVYHTDYGSRIPPEVGAIQGADEAQRLAAFGESAIVSDPRTSTIAFISASVLPGFQASLSASVIPIGPAQQPILVNETIGTLP